MRWLWNNYGTAPQPQLHSISALISGMWKSGFPASPSLTKVHPIKELHATTWILQIAGLAGTIICAGVWMRID
jgi:hypothetical protein